ncbi:MAG TPA: asparaginase [Solirubrobacterales bacterium]|nr:asparaginase [Solirubrobacterales bacterium]
MASRSVVAVVATGGTIASLDRGDGHVVAAVPGSTLVAAAESADGGEAIEVYEAMRVGSYALDAAGMLTIATAALEQARRPEVCGVVVSHGTDTMEETAWLADLLHEGEVPLVFTGAQRHAGLPDSDGPANLDAAIRLAREPGARGLGAVVALGGRIDHAREATKLHTTESRAFGSPGAAGPLGEIGADWVRIDRRPEDRPRFAVPQALEQRVHLVRLAAGCDGSLIDACTDAGARGVVVEAFGIGNANGPVLAAVRRAVASGVVVLITSRCPAGGVAAVYGNGGGQDLLAAGARFGGTLSGAKARVQLMVELAPA